jgi:hypothetical protein
VACGPAAILVAMRTDANGVVAYRSGRYYRMSLLGLCVGAAGLVSAVVLSRSVSGRLSSVLVLVLWMAAWWWFGVRPRVEIHEDRVLVTSGNRRVSIRFDELRQPAFIRSRGVRLQLTGRDTSILVSPGWGWGDWPDAPVEWQVALRDELLDRMGTD